MDITRSAGLATGHGFVCGAGYRGATKELDDLVSKAAAMLAESYGMDVTIRFNSDRKSGSAWLKTDEPDGIWLNAEIGIGGFIVTQEGNDLRRERYGVEPTLEPGVHITAHIGRRALKSPEVANSSGYYHERHASLEDALRAVRGNASLEWMAEA